MPWLGPPPSGVLASLACSSLCTCCQIPLSVWTEQFPGILTGVVLNLLIKLGRMGILKILSPPDLRYLSLNLLAHSIVIVFLTYSLCM